MHARTVVVMNDGTKECEDWVHVADGIDTINNKMDLLSRSLSTGVTNLRITQNKVTSVIMVRNIRKITVETRGQ